MSSQENTENQDEVEIEQPFISHLIELRSRLLRSFICIFSIFICLFYFANDIYALVAAPLLEEMSSGSTMIATEVASPFLAPFKLTLFASLFIGMPYLLYQAWSFVTPGLYSKEQRFALPLLISSMVLFYLGTAFAYFVVFPLLFSFFAAVAPTGVAVMTDISHYLDFVLKIFFAFGLAFEVPVATILLLWSGFATVEGLKKNRPYVIVAAFVIGMLLTPPDIVSQVLLALPIWILFEVGLFFGDRFSSSEELSDQTDQ